MNSKQDVAPIEMNEKILDGYGRTHFGSFLEFMAAAPRIKLKGEPAKVSIDDRLKADLTALTKAKAAYDELLQNQTNLNTARVKAEGVVWEVKNLIQKAMDDKQTLLKIISDKGLPSDSPVEHTRIGEVNTLLEALNYQLNEKKHDLASIEKEASKESQFKLREDVIKTEKDFLRSVLMELKSVFLNSDLLRWIWASSLIGDGRGRLDNIFKNMTYDEHEPKAELLEPTIAEIVQHYAEKFQKEAE